MLEAASTHMFEQAAFASKYLPFRELPAETMAKYEICTGCGISGGHRPDCLQSESGPLSYFQPAPPCSPETLAKRKGGAE